MPNSRTKSTSADPDTQSIADLGIAVIDIEQRSIDALRHRIGDGFAQACKHMIECEGRVVVLGMGKSGHIGSKVAATLASTGTPAFYVHPGEASHGDLGMITRSDVVLAFSNSGETQELLTILPFVKRLDIPLVAITGRAQSTLAKEATVNLDVSVAEEACPLGLTPTSSTTAALVMGDALAISLLQWRGFTKEDFARSHPAGSLGRRLLLRVADIMHTGDDIPTVDATDTVSNAIVEMTKGELGMTAVVDPEDQRQLLGVFTDGDLRRALQRSLDLDRKVADLMTRGCVTVQPDVLAAEAAAKMEQHKVDKLLVVDAESRLIGAMNIHDLLRAGVV